MAMKRVINSIWTEISAWGSLVKTATNPYNPSPGSSVGGANNQGLAAITSSSPFIVVDRNAISADVPVATNLTDGANASPTAIDENSGNYHAVRQYGDIYLFNDGNVIAWGGNGKNFSFGNGYEENHAWANQACVYNNETYQIPVGAMTSFSPSSLPDGMFPDPSATLAQWEWLGGNVSKSWGNDYSYSYGSSYEWSSGPSNYIDAFGNVGAALTDVMQGKHCTFSYGTGYEEALITWADGAGWFHADDSSSPYKNRKYDDWTSTYLSMQTVATSFAQSAGDQVYGNVLGILGVGGAANEEAINELAQAQAGSDTAADFNARNTWKAANLLVSKTFGNTYDYHYGPGLDIHEGPSEERVHGNSTSSVVGDSSETVTGNSSSTVNGNSTENVNGNSTAMIKGNATEQFWGGKAEFFMGGKSEMILAACDEVTLSVKIELKTLGAMEVFGGLAIAMFLGMQIEIQAGAKIEVGELEVKNKAASVKVNDAANVQVNGAASVQSSPVNVVTP